MLIRNKLHISTLLTVASVFLVGLVIFTTYHKVSEATEHEAMAYRLVQDVFHLTILTNDYLLHHTQRSEIQCLWLAFPLEWKSTISK